MTLPSLTRLKWSAILLPIIAVGTVEVVRHLLPASTHAVWAGHLLTVGVVAVAAVVFFTIIFNIIGEMQAENARLFEEAQKVAVLEERERIAREMHDGVAQVLGYVNMKTGTLSQLLASGQIAQAQEQLDQVAGVTQEAYADVRECILGLKSTVSLGRGLLPTLAEYLRKYSLQGDIHARLVVKDGAATAPLPPAAEVQLLRIIQEALANVRKHAQATHAWVVFEADDGWARVTIEDNGRGFDLSSLDFTACTEADSVAGRRNRRRSNRQHFGLQTMRERAESVGGVFTVVPRTAGGTKVVAEIPLGLGAESVGE